MVTLIKRTGEMRTYHMDFSLQPELVGGETLAALTSVVATPTGLTITPSGVAAGKAAFVVSGGPIDGQTFLLTVTVTTSGGSILVGLGKIKIRDS